MNLSQCKWNFETIFKYKRSVKELIKKKLQTKYVNWQIECFCIVPDSRISKDKNVTDILYGFDDKQTIFLIIKRNILNYHGQMINQILFENPRAAWFICCTKITKRSLYLPFSKIHIKF